MNLIKAIRDNYETGVILDMINKTDIDTIRDNTALLSLSIEVNVSPRIPLALIEKGVKVNGDDKVVPPLYLACLKIRDHRIAIKLIEHGADINKGVGATTPLRACLLNIESGNIIPTMLINKGAKLCYDYIIPLYIKRGYYMIVYLLLSKAKENNIKNLNNTFCEAILSDKTDKTDNMCKMILKLGINKDIHSLEYVDILETAIEYKAKNKIIKALVDCYPVHKKCKYSILYNAYKLNDDIAIYIIKKLFMDKTPHNINTLYIFLRSIIEEMGSFNVFKAIIDTGIDINGCYYNDVPLLHLLIKKNIDINVIYYLIDKGAILDIVYEGKSALDMIIENNIDMDHS